MHWQTLGLNTNIGSTNIRLEGRKGRRRGEKKGCGIPNNGPFGKAKGSGDSRSFILHLRIFVTSGLKSFPPPCHSSEVMPRKRHRAGTGGEEWRRVRTKGMQISNGSRAVYMNNPEEAQCARARTAGLTRRPARDEKERNAGFIIHGQKL